MYHLEYYDPITQSVFIKHHIPSVRQMQQRRGLL